MEQKEEKMVRISATIPQTVLDQFKQYCREERRSVSAQITILMEKALSEKLSEQTKQE